MNRLRMLLISTALIAGSSVLASAQEYRHDRPVYQQRDRDQNWGRDRDDRGRYGNYGYGDGDHDRDDGYRRQQVYRDNRWRNSGDRDDRWQRNRNHGYDRDHDGDRH